MSHLPARRVHGLWLSLFCLLFACAGLPLASAEAQDMKAVEKKLGEAIAEGDLTIEQAQVMMRALRAHVDSHPDARPMQDRPKPGLEPRPMPERDRDRVEQSKDGDRDHSKGKSRETDRKPPVSDKAPKPREDDKAKKPEAEEVDPMIAQFRQIGVEPKAVGNVKKVLSEMGVKEQAMRGALEALLRTSREIAQKGDKYEMNPRTVRYLGKDLKLNEKQIEQFERLATRLSQGIKADKKPEEKRGR